MSDEPKNVKGSEAIAKAEAVGGNAKEMLKAYIERIERLDEEIRTLNQDKSDVYAEAKGSGFDKKALRTIVQMRRQDPDERIEHDTIVETYMQALGMI